MIKVTVLNINGDSITITDGSEQRVVTRDELNKHIDCGDIEIEKCLQVMCIEKHRGKNNIIEAYSIQDTDGNVTCCTPAQLKTAMYNYKIRCLNLMLTHDGRLFNKGAETPKNKVKDNNDAKQTKGTDVESNSANINAKTEYTDAEKELMQQYYSSYKKELIYKANQIDDVKGFRSSWITSSKKDIVSYESTTTKKDTLEAIHKFKMSGIEKFETFEMNVDIGYGYNECPTLYLTILHLDKIGVYVLFSEYLSGEGGLVIKGITKSTLVECLEWFTEVWKNIPAC